jgi:hypothetical protein
MKIWSKISKKTIIFRDAGDAVWWCRKDRDAITFSVNADFSFVISAVETTVSTSAHLLKGSAILSAQG